MTDSPEKNNSTPLVPLLVGAAVGGALAYLFVSEANSENGGKLTESLGKSWDALKEKLPFIEDELNSFKEKIMDTVKANLNPESGHVTEEIKEV